jgi:hypothetical protein
MIEAAIFCKALFRKKVLYQDPSKPDKGGDLGRTALAPNPNPVINIYCGMPVR